MPIVLRCVHNADKNLLFGVFFGRRRRLYLTTDVRFSASSLKQECERLRSRGSYGLFIVLASRGTWSFRQRVTRREFSKRRKPGCPPPGSCVLLFSNPPSLSLSTEICFPTEKVPISSGQRDSGKTSPSLAYPATRNSLIQDAVSISRARARAHACRDNRSAYMVVAQIGRLFVRQTFSFSWRYATSTGNGLLIRPLPVRPRKTQEEP